MPLRSHGPQAWSICCMALYRKRLLTPVTAHTLHLVIFLQRVFWVLFSQTIKFVRIKLETILSAVDSTSYVTSAHFFLISSVSLACMVQMPQKDLSFSDSLLFGVSLVAKEDGKESACNTGDPGLIPGSKISWKREWQPTMGIEPWWATVHWGHTESNMTEQLTLQVLTALTASVSVFVSLKDGVCYFNHCVMPWPQSTVRSKPQRRWTQLALIP